MVKNNKLILPTDIINIIVEYSVNKCSRCGKENIRKYYKYRISYIGTYRQNFICSKCVFIIIKNDNGINYKKISNTFYFSLFQTNLILKIDDYEREDLIIIDEKQIKKQLENRIKEDVIEIIKNNYTYYRFASKKEIYKTLLNL